MELCGSVPGSVVLRERNKDRKGPGSNLREKLRLTKNSRYTQNTRDKMKLHLHNFKAQVTSDKKLK